ncbi:uncharacterized protein [Sinocyclocheilus grahami]|uniref:uncharacterized protein n=1 Tax=Sinocyclocheilus grahami TaxID=75366 RepID=UPI0007AD5E31|nr:PREDICTED: uncharacterized protein LOC107576527 [Sinocyclocheilus grahami]
MDTVGVNVIETAALGRPFQLGMLYDCRKDALIPGITLWHPEKLQESLRTRPQIDTDFKVSASDSIEDKSTLLNIDGSLKLSLLGGLVNVTGAAKYLNDTKKSFRQQRLTLHYHSTSRFEELTMNHLASENIVYRDVFDNDAATHVVTAVLYGANACFVFDREVSADENKSTVDGEVNAALDALKFISVDINVSLKMNDVQKNAVQKFTCTFYGDFQLPSKPTSFEDVLKVFTDLPKLLGEKKELAVPLRVWLYPLDKLHSKASKLQKDISMDLITATESVIESLNTAEMKCSDLLKDSPALTFAEFQSKIQQMKQNCYTYKLKLMKKLGSLLPNIRGDVMKETELNDLLKEHNKSPFRGQDLAEWLKERERESEIIKSVLRQLKNAGAQVEVNLDVIWMDLEVGNLVCYTFTSLDWTDVLLPKQTTYLNPSAKGENDVNCPDSEQKSWLSPEIQKSMKSNLKIFKNLINSEDCKPAKFIVSSREMKNNPGSCILLYESECDEAVCFIPPSKPVSPVTEEITENTMVLKVPPVCSATVELRLLYKLKQDSVWKSKPVMKNQHTVTLTNLRAETEYEIRCAALGKLYTVYSDVTKVFTEGRNSMSIGIDFEGDGHSTTFSSTEGRSSPAVSESSQFLKPTEKLTNHAFQGSWNRLPDAQNRPYVYDWISRAPDSQKHTSNTSVSDSGIEEASSGADEETSDPALRPQTHSSDGRRVQNLNVLKNPGVSSIKFKPSVINPKISIQTQSSVSEMLKRRLKEEFQYLNEKPGESQKLNDVFIEPHITEKTYPHISDKRQNIRTVLMKGDAGTGKSVTVQKFILDWAEEKSNTDIDYIFPIPFQKLNIIRETVTECSFMQLLQRCFENTEHLKLHDSDRIILVFDGLNEFKLQNTKRITDLNDPASVSDLLTNLIKGNLLPNAQIWITSRPAAANQIPARWIDRVTEIQGFDDQQKQKYFRKSISDQRMSDKVISHIQKSPRISSMCYLPDYCRIIAAIPEMFSTGRDDFPKTLTQMYSRLLLAQTELIRERRETIIALGRIAFHLLVNRNSLFCYEDLKKCGIRDESDLIRSSIIKKIEDKSKCTSFCFVNHRTQEFLAALYVTEVINVNNPLQLRDLSSLKLELGEQSFTRHHKLQDVMESALHKQMDLFFCFVLGLMLESSQRALKDLLTQRESSSSCSQLTVQHIQTLIMNSSPDADKCSLLFDALKELDERYLIQQIKTQLKSGLRLSPDQFSALVFVLLNSEEQLAEIKSHRSEEHLLMLRPVLKTSGELKKSNPNSKNPKQGHISNKQPKQATISPKSSTQSHSSVSKMFKLRLKEEFQYLTEDILSGEKRQLLNDVFIEPHITEKTDPLIGDEREIMCRNMFEGQNIRTVLLKGDAGTGKTVTVQKFILDWAEEKSNTHIDYIFLIPFQKLNIIRETVTECSFMQLLQQCFENTMITDLNDPASVSDLLTNLIKGDLLPNAQIWITSRPAAANQIPARWIDRVTEIQGFDDQQREEYFRKSISGGNTLQLRDLSNLNIEIGEQSFTDYNSLQKVMDFALQRQMDLFFCFVLGLMLESSQRALKDLLTQRESSSSSGQLTVQHIKTLIMNSSPDADKCSLLFDALKELDERYLIQQIKTQLKSGLRLSPDQFSALVFVLLN